MKKDVLRLDLNADKAEVIYLWFGRIFHKVGPATEKALLPQHFKQSLPTNATIDAINVPIVAMVCLETPRTRSMVWRRSRSLSRAACYAFSMVCKAASA